MISFLKQEKWVVPGWVYWLFFTITGLTILMLEDQFKGQDKYGIAIFIYFLFLFLVIARWVFTQTKLVINLKNERAKTELMHLQSQVSPHFFFNMLNNLYGWVDKDPKKAKELILKISDMMRYSIYDGQKSFISLSEEIQYLKNYIALHKMRYLKKIGVSFNIDIQEEDYKVMPLLFIILIENAFKHGVENLGEKAYIKIELKAIANEIYFSVENNFDPEIIIEQKGIGLKNLRRRLELVYPNKHTLNLSANEDIYKAQLTIQLT